MEKELILTIKVRCLDAFEVSGHTKTVVMVPFTGEASGECFAGRVIGTGCDTQKISKDGECRLSARYMLEGKDSAGQSCRIFIENESREDGTLCPSIVTDSRALARWENDLLSSQVEPSDNGVTVRIYRHVS